MAKQNSLLEYLKVFATSPAVAYKIAEEFDAGRVLTIPMNMAFRTFVADRAKRKLFEDKSGFKLPSRISLDIGDYCNLHCHGCYVEREGRVMSADLLERIIAESEDLGIHMTAVYGGEPFHPKTRDILFENIRNHSHVIYGVCTNATFVPQSEVIDGIQEYKNLFPVVSLDGLKDTNDLFRGNGVFDKVSDAMDLFKERKIFYGVSTVVRPENVREVSGYPFFGFLDSKNARILYFRQIINSQRGTDLESSDPSEEFLSRLEEVSRCFGIHVLGGEVRNPSRRDLGKRENHNLHFCLDGSVRYGRFGPVVGDVKKSSVYEVLTSQKMKEAVDQNFARLYQN